jgi:hypothetical protein
MKKPVTKKSAFLSSIIIVLGSFASYIGYYDRIGCKPSHAGFWYVIILGFTLGVMVTLFGLWINEIKTKKKELKEDTKEEIMDKK